MSAAWPRSTMCALLLALVAPGCGADGTGPGLELYEIVLEPVNNETLPDGTIRHFYRARVTGQGSSLRIAGAWMLFAATAGDVIPQTDRTDLNGNGRVEWVLDREDYASIGTATLSGCAQNLAPPDCTPEPLVTLTFE